MTAIAVIGLGYVGLPLVIEFGKCVIGFDICAAKVEWKGDFSSAIRPSVSIWATASTC